jgi:hypothetical protein
MSGKMPIVISHYTTGTGYTQEVLKLIASLEKWNLRYDIEAIEPLGAWRVNSNYCSRSVQKMLARYPEDDILRVDADAVFQRFPDLFLSDEFSGDIAAHVHDFRWHRNELLGGTIFFRNTANVRRLVDRWAYECMEHRPSERNPDLLQEIIKSGQFNVQFAELPPEYCKIFDIMRDVQSPVIEHFQASRRFRIQVNDLWRQKIQSGVPSRQTT